MRILSGVMLAAALLGAEGLRAQTPVTAQSRPMLEQQLRERVAQITRKRLQLDDAQMAKLQTVNARYAPQIGSLVSQERQTRQQLRAQLTSPTPDQAVVGKLLDDVTRIQKQRIATLESEQHDLSAFLTPVQRAKYMALQAQIKRRADQLRAGKGGQKNVRAGNRPPR